MNVNAGRIIVPVSETVGGVMATITMTGLRAFNLRCWVGMQLLRLASWVLPVHTHVEVRQ